MGTLRPKYLLYGYMEPLGLGSSGFGSVFCRLTVRSVGILEAKQITHIMA